MAKADVLALVDFLGGGAIDPVTVEKYYNDTMTDLARENWTTDAQAFAVTRGFSEIDLSVAVAPFVNLLGLIYDDYEIDELPLRQLEMLDPYWRTVFGRPTSFTRQDENDKTVALYPTPDINSNPLGGTYGEPLGGDYTTYNMVMFYSRAMIDPLQPPYYLELVAALHILMREFNRVSDHPDPQMCETAMGLERLFKEMLT